MQRIVASDAVFARPLLDRLMLGEEGRETSARIPLQDHQEIIRRDVESLLESRSSLSMREAAEAAEPLSVSEYGLPDFAHLSVQSDDDLRLLARAVRVVIASFETRLRDVDVQASPRGAVAVDLAVTARLAACDGGEFSMWHTLAIGG
ncbi:MAG: type VI secretion system baseplate subunit TssE [Planctomycetaceae bacterium]|nr:type VI secretion system baseplate subunit TssE [Planctomycetaceae bacterium]